MFEGSPWLQSEGKTSFLMLALLKEIDLLSLSGSYESAPSHRVVLPFTGAAHWQADDDSQAAPRCVCVRACLLHIAKCVRARFPPGAWRQKFVNGCTDCRHSWDSSRFQTTSDKMGGRKRPLERAACCQSYPLWNERRCNISQDKGSSV